MSQSQGMLIVFSGPSGVGKGTVLREYLQEHPNVKLSVSATTRAPRPGEVDGVHYHFVSQEQFQTLIQQDGLLEYACYSGNYYGTPKKAVQEQLEQGNHVVLEIEVQGALQILRQHPQALLIFVMPPSYQELERRLRQGVTPEACGSAFACAGACLACAALYETDTAGSGGVSFRAGDVSVTASAGGESTASTKALRELAERMMAPYLDDGGFCFRGVRA